MPKATQDELRAILVDANSNKYKLDQTNETIGKGLGLKNIAERIKLHYGDPYYLDFSSREGEGTTVELLIPIANK
ncbi:hypothetical protein D3C81_2244680 [compost metagenome]